MGENAVLRVINIEAFLINRPLRRKEVNRMLQEFSIYQSDEGHVHLYFSDDVHVRFADLPAFKRFVGICALTVKQADGMIEHTVEKTRVPNCFKDALDEDL